MQRTTLLTPTRTTTWRIDPTHTSVEYAVRHMFTQFRGVLRGAEGTLRWDPAHPEDARVEASLDLRGIDTGLPDRDAHLRSADFFDVERHPTATLRGHGLTPRGDGRYEMVVDLTFRGVTRPLRLEVELLGEGADAWGAYRAGALARGTLARKDYGMIWNAALDRGGIVLGDEVKLELHVEAIREEA